VLQISKRSLAALEQSSLRGFAVRLTANLLEDYPDELGPYPKETRPRIVANMVDRARARWKLQSQEAITSYCELMLSVAPNFDEDPDIQRALRAEPDPDSSIFQLTNVVHDRVWKHAQAKVACLPLYLPRDLIDAPIEKRVEAAARLLLPDRIPPDALAHGAVFWDRENEGPDVKVADTFNALLERLEPFDEDAVHLDPDDVESVWIDPGFRPDG
jgi:hypothetical protein